MAFSRSMVGDEPLTRREVRQHLRRIWKKLKHAMELRNNIESQDASTTLSSVNFLNKITEHISRKTKSQLIISARKNFYSEKN